MSEKGTFMWAIEQMKQGKKVTRKTFTGLKEFDKNQKMFLWDDIEATDWEVVEEPKKTLYEKLANVYETGSGSIYKVVSMDEVKDALKEFIGEISESKLHREEVVELVKEIFGEEMIE